ncbi:hypothetical protein BDQ12DRAFT_578358, partial [Crucibulum laeve]
IISNKLRYKALLDCRGDKAQHLLDLLKAVRLPRSMESSILTAMLRLSTKSSRYPKCLSLNRVERESVPMAAGQFGEIWKGNLNGKVVCLKVVKLYQQSEIQKLLNAFSREAIIWSHLFHPNVLPFYGIYRLEDMYGRLCLVSPWMENGNVIEYVSKRPQ